MSEREQKLLTYYNSMLAKLGSSQWWPGDNPFEIIVGAILTQNTSWTNVEKAINSLKKAKITNAAAMLALEEEYLASLIKSAGYFNLKAKRLKNFLAFLEAEALLANASLSDNSFDYLQEYTLETLREKLLAVSGIGPETADSILLYAFNKPSFVIDTYTRRIFSRHGFVEPDMPYDELRDFFMDVLPQEVSLYNEYHALIVRIAKDYCLKNKPRCELCPLKAHLEYEIDI